MAHKRHSSDFKREAVKLALTSGLPREAVAADLGIGKSTLGKWITQYRRDQKDASEPLGGAEGVQRELTRLPAKRTRSCVRSATS